MKTNRKRRFCQAVLAKIAKRKGLHPELIADIEPDKRPFSWPKRRKQEASMEKRPIQLNINGVIPMTDETKLGLIQKTLQQPIVFHRIFADITSSALTGLFLSHFWHLYLQHRWSNDGWFVVTMKEWAELTTMSRREIEAARKRLVELGITQEERNGVPAEIQYRLVPEALAIHIDDFYQEAAMTGPGISDVNLSRAESIRIGDSSLLNNSSNIIESTETESLENHSPDIESLDNQAQNIIETDNNIKNIQSKDSVTAHELSTDTGPEANWDEFFEAASEDWADWDAPPTPAPIADLIPLLELSATTDSTRASHNEEQAQLFKTGKRRKLKRNSQFNSIPEGHKQMAYAICYGADNAMKIRSLDKRQIGRVSLSLEKLQSAGADLNTLRAFEIWWRNTWMSRNSETKMYQFPRPEQLVEFWWQFHQNISRQKEAEAKNRATAEANNNVDIVKMMSAKTEDEKKGQ